MKKESLPKEIEIQANEFGIEPQRAANLIGNLPQIQNERAEMSKQYEEVIRMDIEAKETAKAARELRIRIKDNRTKGLQTWYRTTKDYFLKGGQFVDAIRRKEEAVNLKMEEDLEQIEKYAEIKKQKEIDELRAKRLQEIKPYHQFASLSIDLGTISEEEYVIIFKGAKLQYEADIEAKRQEEIKRLELERVREIRANKIGRLLPYAKWIDNFNDFDFDQITDEQIDEIIKEAEEKNEAESKAKALAIKEAAEAKMKLEQERAEMEEKLRKEAELRAKERAEMEEKLRIEREKQAKIQEELRKKEAEEEKRKKEELQKQRKLKNASDKVILNDIANNLKHLPTQFPEVKGEEAKAIMAQTVEYLNKVAKFITDKTAKLD
jgi:colicin import membrane protein